MVSKLTLLANLLLVSGALAAPSSRLGARLARRRENRQSQPLNRIENHGSDDSPSTNWAGAVWDEDAGTFTSVTGTFTVPTPSGTGAAAAWVGIDGDSCQNAILQTGVDFTVDDDGNVSYDAWYEWWPDNSYDFSGITINAGDIITATVTAYSTTSGVAVIENQSTGQQVKQDFSSQPALCEQNAEWIVEDFQVNGSEVQLTNFGSVTFSDATATTPDGTGYTPSGANILEIVQNGHTYTSASVDGNNDLTITYQPQ